MTIVNDIRKILEARDEEKRIKLQKEKEAEEERKKNEPTPRQKAEKYLPGFLNEIKDNVENRKGYTTFDLNANYNEKAWEITGELKKLVEKLGFNNVETGYREGSNDIEWPTDPYYFVRVNHESSKQINKK